MENFDIKSFALGVSSNSGGGYPEPTGTKNITENGVHNVKDYAEANVNVPVPPSPTGTINITQNGTYDVTDKAEAQVNVPTTEPDLEDITITANGTYESTQHDGYGEVTVNVPDIPADIEALTVNANGTYTATECDGFSPVTVNVPTPTPDLEDITITQNGTYNHPNKDGYDEVTVNVPNTYTSSDEGKVVNNGALASQTSTTKTANGTYDTTLNNEVVVNVPQPSGNINITDMNSTDVSAYATAQVVDSDLVASNIKKDINILGITGTYEGSSEYNVLHVRNVPAKQTGNLLFQNRWLSNTTSINLSDYNSKCLADVEILNPNQIDTSVTAFAGFTPNGNGAVYANPSTVIIPNDFFDYYPNLTTISDHGMMGLIQSDTFDFKQITQIGWYGIQQDNIVPARILKFPNVATFENMISMGTRANFPNLEKLDFSGNTNITTIPKMTYNYWYINDLVLDFTGCVNITSIDSNAFVFSFGTTGQHIYLPFEEGEVAGAPWGADEDHTTLHYGCVS